MTRDPSLWTRRATLAAAAAVAVAGRAGAEDLPWRLPKLRNVKLQGHRIAYFEMGSGPPLVLVHGMSGSPALEWGRVMTPLARKFRVIAPYQIGFGPSDQPDLPYDAATFVDYLGGFLHARVAEDAVILGESFGGWVVSQYALRQGTKTAWGQPLPRISRLVITDGAVQLPAGAGGGAEKPSINSPEVAKLTHDFFVSQPPVDDSKVKGAVGPNIQAQQATDDQLKTLKLPTLLIWGREDQLIPLELGRHVAAQIPKSRLVIIDNCGHIPSVEQPRAFLGALGGFLGVGLENL